MATAADILKKQYKAGTLSEENKSKIVKFAKQNIASSGGDRKAGLETTMEALKGAGTPKMTTGLPKKQDLSNMIGAKGYQEGQVGIPGVNLTQQKTDQSLIPTEEGDKQVFGQAFGEGVKDTTTTDTTTDITDDTTGMKLGDIEDKLTELKNKQKEEGLKASDYRAIQDQIEYYESAKTNIDRTKEDQARSAELASITGDIEDIQSSARIKSAANQLSALKQNIGYIGTMGSPGVSQQKLSAMETQISDAEKVYQDVVRVESLYKAAQKIGKAGKAAQYERQLEDLQNDLNDKVNQTIQDALSNLTQKEISEVIEDPEEMENIRINLLNQLDKDIASITEANFRKRQYVIDQMTDIVADIQTKEANKQKINNDMSIIQGYYVDGNGDPIISATTGQRILIPTEAPMEPVYDKTKGQLITFSYDENGNIVANVDKISDDITFEEKTLANYATLYANGKLSISGMQDMGLTQEQISNVVGQSAGITPTTEAPKLERIGTDDYGNPVYGTWNQATGKYEPIQTTTGETFTGDYTTLDFSTNQNLINKYPMEASFKNNNPTGITWNANFEAGTGIAKLLDEAGISYSIGTSRPSAEGGNYVKFETIQDGLDGYFISLTQGGSDDVNERLQAWVGTAEGPTYAANLMAQAGIPQGAKFSELNETQMSALMDAQLRKESPNFYKELTSLGQVEEPTVAEGYDEASVPDFQNYYKTGKITSADQKRLKKEFGSIEEFKRQAKLYGDSNKTAQFKFASEVKELANMLKDEEGRYHRMSAGVVQYTPFGSNEADFLANLNSLKSKLSLQNLIDLKAGGATFGSLSNQELNFITNASTALNKKMSDDRWKEELNKIVAKMDEVINKTNLTDEQKAELDRATGGQELTIQDEYKKYIPEGVEKTGAGQTDPLDIGTGNNDPLNLGL